MAFRIRDLMISVVPSPGGGCVTCTGTTGQGCGGHTDGCMGRTGYGCVTCTGTTNVQYDLGGCVACTGTTADNGCVTCTGTTGNRGNGGGGCVACTGTTGGLCAHAAALAACGVCTGISPAVGDQRPQALAQLRQQLQGLLAEVEAEEQRLADAGAPQSLEEAEELEKKLEDALAEVRSRKAGFGKKKKG
jgi:hypothetical protein